MSATSCDGESYRTCGSERRERRWEGELRSVGAECLRHNVLYPGEVEAPPRGTPSWQDRVGQSSNLAVREDAEVASQLAESYITDAFCVLV